METYRFPKTERLCSRKLIDELFAQGAQVRHGGLRFLFLPLTAEHQSAIDSGLLRFAPPVQVMMVTPKRRYRKAALRNRRKRRLREAWRLESAAFKQQLLHHDQAIALAIFDFRHAEGAFTELRAAMQSGLQKVTEKVEN